MEINIRQIKINNRPDYLFNDNMIVDIKDFYSSLLKIYKLSFKGFLVLIFTTLNTSLQKVLMVQVLIELIMIMIIVIYFLMM